MILERLESDWEAWVAFLYPEQVTSAFAPHHGELWEWAWAIEDGIRSEPLVECLSRSGGKSTNVEMAISALAARRRRRYCLLVGGTQDQANGHVADLGRRFESPWFERFYPDFAKPSVGKFGNTRGWNRTRLATAGGFTVDAVGLDTAMRGVKIDADRPDLLVIDEVDSATDSPRVTERKMAQLTRSLLPTMAEHGTVLAVQNLVLPNGIFARILGVSENAETDLLVTAKRVGPIPAIRDLQLRQEQQDDGRMRWRIESGEPTWVGQGIERCEAQIADFGRTAFLIECQHQVELREGGMFKAFDWMAEHWVHAPFPVESHIWRIRCWDTAATEPTGDNDPDFTAGVLMAVDLKANRYRIEDVVRFRHAFGSVKNLVRTTAEADVEAYGRGRMWFGIEQEPGPHGRDRATAWIQDTLAGFNVVKLVPSGAKPERAEGLAGAMENGLVEIVGQPADLATNHPGTNAFLAEHQAFPGGDHDDMVDADAYAFNWCQDRILKKGVMGGGTSLGAMVDAGQMRR